MCSSDGLLNVQATRKPGEHCVIDFPPEALLEVSPYFWEDELMGVYKHRDNSYVSKESFKRPCSLTSDLNSNSVLAFLSQLVGIIFAITLFCLILTFCQYKKVS